MLRQRLTLSTAILRRAACLLLALSLGGAALAQRIRSDEPLAYQDPTTTHTEPEHGTAYNVCSAICWYIPNRILDFIDIPKLYLGVGDGNGIELRATKFLDATWVNNDISAIGLADRESVGFFTASRDERHFGFLAAQEGAVTGDPTEIGLGFHIIVLGAHLGVSLKEALDFVTGVVGIDLAGDDHGPTWQDYTPEPVMEAGKNPVPDSPLPPAGSIPDPTPIEPSHSADTTPSTLAPPTSALPMSTETNTTSTSQIYEIHTEDKTLPVPPKQ